MNDCTDRPTPIERQGEPDCLVCWAQDWFQRPLASVTDPARTEQLAEIALVIAQMRHVPAKRQDLERQWWIARVASLICTTTPGATGEEGGVQLQLERFVTSTLLHFHQWREQHARPFAERTAQGDR